MDKNSKAILYMRENKLDKAAKLFDEIIAENPDDPVGYINFGNLLQHIQEFDRAIKFYEKAITLDDNAATAYYGLGGIYYEQSKFEEAQKNYQKAISLGLDEADVYYMLGMTFQQQSQYKLSLPYLQRASELNGNDMEILFQYGLSLAQVNEVDHAKAIFQNVIKQDEQHSDAHYNLGVIALYQDDPKTSLHHFNAALAVQPDHLLAANGKKKVEEFLKENDR